jgi:hypothetical protein
MMAALPSVNCSVTSPRRTDLSWRRWWCYVGSGRIAECVGDCGEVFNRCCERANRCVTLIRTRVCSDTGRVNILKESTTAVGRDTLVLSWVNTCPKSQRDPELLASVDRQAAHQYGVHDPFPCPSLPSSRPRSSLNSAPCNHDLELYMVHCQFDRGRRCFKLHRDCARNLGAFGCAASRAATCPFASTRTSDGSIHASWPHRHIYRLARGLPTWDTHDTAGPCLAAKLSAHHAALSLAGCSLMPREGNGPVDASSNFLPSLPGAHAHDAHMIALWGDKRAAVRSSDSLTSLS